MIDPNPTAETLITGDASKNLHLNTVEDIDCVHCYDEAFFGMPVDQVSKKISYLNFSVRFKYLFDFSS